MSRHLHGVDGPVVVVSARVAAVLSRMLSLDGLRQSVRGQDRELDEVLTAFAAASAAWRASVASAATSDVGSSLVSQLPSPDDGGHERPGRISSLEAAALVGVSDRAIRSAAADERLPALRLGDGAWSFDPLDVADFAARRNQRRSA